MVPFERALVSSYRASIVTFPLPLRVSKILLLLCFSMPLFPTPPLLSLFTPTFPWEYLGGLWARKSEGVGLIVRAIIIRLVPKISNLCAPDAPKSQTMDRPTDGRYAIAIPRFAL